jgi:hypothetical protein
MSFSGCISSKQSQIIVLSCGTFSLAQLVEQLFRRFRRLPCGPLSVSLREGLLKSLQGELVTPITANSLLLRYSKVRAGKKVTLKEIDGKVPQSSSRREGEILFL